MAGVRTGAARHRNARPSWHAAFLVICLGILVADVAVRARGERDRAQFGTPMVAYDRDVLADLDAVSLDPGEIRVVTRRAYEWTKSGLIGWLPIPAARAEHWVAVSTRSQLDAIAVRGSTGRGVVFLPQLDGTSRPAELAARHFASRGDAVLAVLPSGAMQHVKRDERAWAHDAERRVREARLALHIAREELALRCVTLVGLSMGALAAVPAAAIDGHTDALVLMLAGGGLPDIAATAEQAGLIELLHGTDAGDQPVSFASVDPLAHATRLDSDRVLLIHAAFDRVMAPRATEALARRLPGATRIWFPTGHRSFALAFPFALRAASEHADRFCDARRSSLRR